LRIYWDIFPAGFADGQNAHNVFQTDMPNTPCLGRLTNWEKRKKDNVSAKPGFKDARVLDGQQDPSAGIGLQQWIFLF